MPPFDVLALRPCGPCRAYVFADKGCAHWRPQKAARAVSARTPGQRAAAAEARRQQRANAAAAMAFLKRLTT